MERRLSSRRPGSASFRAPGVATWSGGVERRLSSRRLGSASFRAPRMATWSGGVERRLSSRRPGLASFRAPGVATWSGVARGSRLSTVVHSQVVGDEPRSLDHRANCPPIGRLYRIDVLMLVCEFAVEKQTPERPEIRVGVIRSGIQVQAAVGMGRVTKTDRGCRKRSAGCPTWQPPDRAESGIRSRPPAAASRPTIGRRCAGAR